MYMYYNNAQWGLQYFFIRLFIIQHIGYNYYMLPCTKFLKGWYLAIVQNVSMAYIWHCKPILLPSQFYSQIVNIAYAQWKQIIVIFCWIEPNYIKIMWKLDALLKTEKDSRRSVECGVNKYYVHKEWFTF